MNDINELNSWLETSLAGIRDLSGAGVAVGNAIETPAGVTVIPVSRVTLGFAGGGVDNNDRKPSPILFGGGAGTGASITPVAFLTVGPGSDIRLIPVEEKGSNVGRIADLIEKAPEIVGKIKDRFS